MLPEERRGDCNFFRFSYARCRGHLVLARFLVLRCALAHAAVEEPKGFHGDLALRGESWDPEPGVQPVRPIALVLGLVQVDPTVDEPKPMITGALRTIFYKT